MSPVRIQRRRTRGWKMPPNTVYVGRPSIWGNPFAIGRGASDRADAVAQFRAWIDKNGGLLPPRYMMPISLRVIRESLAGKHLACWCPLDQPCHADVLLELANR